VYTCVSTTLAPSVRRRGARRNSQLVVSACFPENLQHSRRAARRRHAPQ